MAYVRPGVEISQVQRSDTPKLTSPDLEACIVGSPYHWQDITLDESVYSVQYSNAQLTINLSGINSAYHSANSDMHIVDLIGISGINMGKVKHLEMHTHFSTGTSGEDGTVTISGNVWDTGSYLVRIGYRDTMADTSSFHIIESPSDIEQVLGKPVSWNPVGFGTSIAMKNSAKTITALSTMSGSDAGEIIDSINEVLPLQEIYAIAPMALFSNSEISDLKTHCTTYSAAVEKKERMGIACRLTNYTNFNPVSMTSTDRATDAAIIRDANASFQSDRLISIHPDAGYIIETRHISTVKIDWIDSSFSNASVTGGASTLFKTRGIYAKLISDITVGNTKYKAGTDITDSLWTILSSAGWGGSNGMVTVYAPVPGFYFSAQVAGQIISGTIDQPLTNVPGSGIDRTIGSQDLFSEANLNMMAEGGTYIMTQDTKFSPISSRHQLTTDITSIAKQEVSILKQRDYTAKFLRRAVKPYIGRYNITPDFLKKLTSIINGVGSKLVEKGVLNGFALGTLQQDTLAPDTITCEITITVKYPVNYIKILLIF